LDAKRMVVEIRIDYHRCTSCKKCIEACAFGVLEWFDEHLMVANPSNCPACLACKKNCPADAIEVKEK